MSLVPGSEPADLGAVTPVATQTRLGDREVAEEAIVALREEVAAKLAAMGGSRSVARII